MTRLPPQLAILLPLAALATGCATSPAAPRTAAPAAFAAGPDCRQLRTQITHAEEARRAAAEKEKDAWKAVVPFAVAARYASGKAAAGQADRQLAGLKAEYGRQGCDRHGA